MVIILPNNYRLPVAVRSFVVLTQPTQPIDGAATVTNDSCHMK